MFSDVLALYLRAGNDDHELFILYTKAMYGIVHCSCIVCCYCGNGMLMFFTDDTFTMKLQYGVQDNFPYGDN